VQLGHRPAAVRNRLRAWIYLLGSATRTGSVNWKAALIYDAPLPPAGAEIAVTLGLTLSSDPAKGRYELWINGAKVAAGTGRTLFSGARVYGKFGIYGGPLKSNRSTDKITPPPCGGGVILSSRYTRTHPGVALRRLGGQ